MPTFLSASGVVGGGPVGGLGGGVDDGGLGRSASLRPLSFSRSESSIFFFSSTNSLLSIEFCAITAFITSLRSIPTASSAAISPVEGAELCGSDVGRIARSIASSFIVCDQKGFTWGTGCPPNPFPSFFLDSSRL